MACERCYSDNQSTFNGEIAIHFPGRNGLDNPIVWTFPKLAVCLHCGFTEFTIAERELTVLVTGTPVEGAIIGSAVASTPINTALIAKLRVQASNGSLGLPSAVTESLPASSSSDLELSDSNRKRLPQA